MTHSQCSHSPITTDDTLDAMALTHDAFAVEFRALVAAGAHCTTCGKTYFGATADAMLRTHSVIRHGKAVAK